MKKVIKNVPIEDVLREAFPHGHPHFIRKLLGEAQLHSDKNHDYAFGGDPLGNFKRIAMIYSLYPKLDLTDRR